MIFVILFCMETEFELLKQYFGTHKKAAKELGVSYTRYNEWRWRPNEMPGYAKKLVELASEKITSNEKAA